MKSGRLPAVYTRCGSTDLYADARLAHCQLGRLHPDMNEGSPMQGQRVHSLQAGYSVLLEWRWTCAAHMPHMLAMTS